MDPNKTNAPSSMDALNSLAYYLSEEDLNALIANLSEINQFLNGDLPGEKERKIAEIDGQLTMLRNLPRKTAESTRKFKSAPIINNQTKVKLMNLLMLNEDLSIGMLEKILSRLVNENKLRDYLVHENGQTIEYLKSLKAEQTADDNSSTSQVDNSSTSQVDDDHEHDDVTVILITDQSEESITEEARAGTPSSISTDHRPPETVDKSGSGTSEVDEREEQAGTEENDTEKRVKANDSGDSGEGRQGEATGERMKRSANAEEEDRSQPAPDKRPKTAESGPSSNKPRSSRVSPRLKGLADKQNVSGASVKNVKINKKYEKQVMDAMQEAGEAYLGNLFGLCNESAAHSKRVTIKPKDLELIKHLKHDRP